MAATEQLAGTIDHAIRVAVQHEKTILFAGPTCRAVVPGVIDVEDHVLGVGLIDRSHTVAVEVQHNRAPRLVRGRGVRRDCLADLGGSLLLRQTCIGISVAFLQLRCPDGPPWRHSVPAEPGVEILLGEWTEILVAAHDGAGLNLEIRSVDDAVVLPGNDVDVLQGPDPLVEVDAGQVLGDDPEVDSCSLRLTSHGFQRRLELCKHVLHRQVATIAALKADFQPRRSEIDDGLVDRFGVGRRRDVARFAVPGHVGDFAGAVLGLQGAPPEPALTPRFRVVRKYQTEGCVNEPERRVNHRDVADDRTLDVPVQKLVGDIQVPQRRSAGHFIGNDIARQSIEDSAVKNRRRAITELLDSCIDAAKDVRSGGDASREVMGFDRIFERTQTVQCIDDRCRAAQCGVASFKNVVGREVQPASQNRIALARLHRLEKRQRVGKGGNGRLGWGQLNGRSVWFRASNRARPRREDGNGGGCRSTSISAPTRCIRG